jgi:predicted HTH transcriptional regulator
MTEEETVQVLIRQPESQVFERKQSLSLQRQGLESLCGMLNADEAQGTVAFGIGPNGELVGVEPGDLDKAQRSISQTITNRFEPRLQCTIRQSEVDGKRVVIVTAQRNRDVAYHEFAGRAFIREGTATRQLNLAEKQSLSRSRNRNLHTGPWKCNRCGLVVGSLNSMVLDGASVRKTYDCWCGGEYWPAT